VSLLALIVDDEAPARAELRYLLERADGVEVVGEAASVREALALASRLDYDVVFCDISMPELTGIDAARGLASWPTSPLVVFVTAHQDYAVQAYSVDGFDYLLKPVSEERLARTIARLQSARRGQPSRTAGPAVVKLPVTRGGSAVLLDPEDVYWAEANGDSSRVATYDELLQSGQSMRELEDILPSARFFRIHRRHLVNLKQVVRLELAESGRWVVQLSDRDGTVLEVARRQTRALKQHLGLR
jgi:DNA-binding LytR/AlgR family response regulator